MHHCGNWPQRSCVGTTVLAACRQRYSYSHPGGTLTHSCSWSLVVRSTLAWCGRRRRVPAFQLCLECSVIKRFACFSEVSALILPVLTRLSSNVCTIYSLSGFFLFACLFYFLPIWNKANSAENTQETVYFILVRSGTDPTRSAAPCSAAPGSAFQWGGHRYRSVSHWGYKKQKIGSQSSISVVCLHCVGVQLTDTALVLSLLHPKVSSYPQRKSCWHSPRRPDHLKSPSENSWDWLTFPLEKNKNTVLKRHCWEKTKQKPRPNSHFLQVLLACHDLLKETFHCGHQMFRIRRVTAGLQTGNKWHMRANRRESVWIRRPRTLRPPQPALCAVV